MADSIFTTEIPLVDGETSPAATTRGLGMRFEVSEDGHHAVSLGAYVSGGGPYATFLVQLFRTSGTPALLAEVDINTLPSPTPGEEAAIALGTPVPLYAADTYVVREFISGAEGFAFSYGQTFPYGSGGVVSSDRCIEDLDIASTDIPANLGSSDWTFHANVYVEPVAASVSMSGICSGLALGTAAATRTALATGVSAAIAGGTAAGGKAAEASGVSAAVANGTAALGKNARATGLSSLIAGGTAAATRRAEMSGIAATVVGGAASGSRAVPMSGVSAAVVDSYMATVVDDSLILRPDLGLILRPDLGVIYRP